MSLHSNEWSSATAQDDSSHAILELD